MRRQIQWLLDQLFPAKCAVCGGTAPAGICPECLDKLPRTPEEIHAQVAAAVERYVG